MIVFEYDMDLKDITQSTVDNVTTEIVSTCNSVYRSSCYRRICKQMIGYETQD